MRVVCIDDSKMDLDGLPKPKKGSIYTVLTSKHYDSKLVQGKYWSNEGVYYTLVELGKRCAYAANAFVVINEEQQDETEFNRNYQTTKA